MAYWEDLQTQVVRSKQTIEKVTDKDATLIERICTFIHEHVNTVVSILTSLSMATLTITLAFKGVFGEEGEDSFTSGSSKDKETLKKSLNKPANL